MKKFKIFERKKYVGREVKSLNESENTFIAQQCPNILRAQKRVIVVGQVQQKISCKQRKIHVIPHDEFFSSCAIALKAMMMMSIACMSNNEFIDLRE